MKKTHGFIYDLIFYNHFLKLLYNISLKIISV